LAVDRREELLIHENAHSNVFLFGDELKNEKIKSLASKKKVYDNRLNAIASLIKMWCAGDGRPINGAFVGFDTSYSASGKTVMPLYF
jgi:hypothetical protein